jgi:N-acetylglucosamine-6-phosphate deacetylase
MKTFITHCTIISPGLEILNGTIVIKDDTIHSVHTQDAKIESPQKQDHVIDAAGLRAVPGFIDIHCHGAAGADVMDGSLEAIETIAKAKLNDGVTSFCPTTLTASHEALAKAAGAVKEYEKDQTYARSLGLHLEGPYINPAYAGAQNKDFIRSIDVHEVLKLAEIVKIAIVSLAPEKEGALEAIKLLHNKKITVSGGHSGATYAECIAAKKAGLTHLTHFCNQMSPLHHRELGLVGAGLLDPELMLEFIADGVHLAPEMLQLIFAHKSFETLMLVTDSIAATGLADGSYVLGGLDVTVTKGVARLTKNNALAGSTLRYYQGLALVQKVLGSVEFLA